MAAERDACRAVFLGEVVQRPHGTDLELHARNSQRIYAVINVQELVSLARIDFDSGEAADPVVLAMVQQNRIRHLDDPRVCHEIR